jgi:hypothetical protein
MMNLNVIYVCAECKAELGLKPTEDSRCGMLTSDPNDMVSVGVGSLAEITEDGALLEQFGIPAIFCSPACASAWLMKVPWIDTTDRPSERVVKFEAEP